MLKGKKLILVFEFFKKKITFDKIIHPTADFEKKVMTNFQNLILRIGFIINAIPYISSHIL